MVYGACVEVVGGDGEPPAGHLGVRQVVTKPVQPPTPDHGYFIKGGFNKDCKQAN